MDDGTLFSTLVRVAPLYALAVMGAIAVARVLPAVMERINERRRDSASEKAGDWTRLREEVGRLDERCQRLEVSEERCRRELGEAHDEIAEHKRRIGELEGFMMGQGQARQEAQHIVSVERLKKDKDE